MKNVYFDTYIGQARPVDGLANDSRGDGGQNEQQDELEAKVGRVVESIAPERQEVHEQQVGQQTGLEEDPGQILALIREGKYIRRGR
jgi:hypothetical protein